MRERLAAAALLLACAAPAAVRAQAVLAPPVKPAPRYTPDLSGFWQLAPGMNPILNPPRPGPDGLPRGWMTMRGWANNTPPPLTPAALERLRARERQELSGEVIEQRTKHCLPSNIFDMMSFSEPMDILQRGDELTVIGERELALPRHVYIGQVQPAAADVVSSINGHSVAHWEGDTLVIDTLGFDPAPYLFVVDYIPHTADLHTTERLHLEDGGKALVAQWTFVDPAVFARPWTVEVRYLRSPPRTEAVEAVCDLNRRGDTFGN